MRRMPRHRADAADADQRRDHDLAALHRLWRVGDHILLRRRRRGQRRGCECAAGELSSGAMPDTDLAEQIRRLVQPKPATYRGGRGHAKAALTADEFRATLKRLQLPQRQLAQRLGVNISAVWRWAQGERPVPQYAVAYLDLLGQLRKALDKPV